MNGQWVGNFSGTNNGNIMINLDRIDDEYRGIAYLSPLDFQIGLAVNLSIPGKKHKFSIQIPRTMITPFDKSRSIFIEWGAVEKYHPGLTFPDLIKLEGNWSERSLSLTWTTSNNTGGKADLTRDAQNVESKIVPKFTSWDGFKRHVSRLKTRRFAFRGQNLPWPLKTAFHRTGRADVQRFISVDIPALHRHLTAKTKHVFDLQIPEHNGAFFNLAQHHGYPTPLLDWSFSPFVAAFFAFRGLTSKAAKDPKNQNKSVRIYVFDSETWNRHMPVVDSLAATYPQISFKEFMAIENERMIPQQGIASYTNVENIEAYILSAENFSKKNFLYAIDVPYRERDRVMRDLSFMGITAGSLFPGLDGACEELKERMFA